MEDFINYRKNKRQAASEERKPVWPTELADTFRTVNKSREDMRLFAMKLKEYLRNKYNTADDDSYKENEEYREGMSLVRKLERLEGNLFDLLHEIRKY